MKKQLLQCTVALMGGLALTLALALLIGQVAPVRADPGVLYVALAGNCNGASPCYGSVQAAVDAAVPGDEIRIAAGSYTGVSAREGVTQVVYISKTVAVRGGYTTANWTTSDLDNNPTTLDAQGQGRVIYVTDNVNASIEGLRITNGDASGLGGGYWGYDCGGGVYIDHGSRAVQLNKNQVFSNTAEIGGGMCLYYGAATLTNNEIFVNTAEGSGGSGGGLWLDRTDGAVLDGNAVLSNNAEYGGGIYLFWGSRSFLKGNVVNSNTAKYSGGGLYVDANDVTLDGNLIRGNRVSVPGTYWWDGGGGLQMRISDAIFVNNVVADNQSAATGGGIKVRGGSVRMWHNTFAHNTSNDGSGIEVFSESGFCSLALTNTILVSQSVGITVTAGNTVTINGILWYNTPITISQSYTATVTVQNQHQGNPAFAADGYHLTADSAATDQGVATTILLDIDREPRPVGAGHDLGADEMMWRATVEPITGATLVYTDTQGSPTIIQIPAGAVTDTITLIYAPVKTVTAPSGSFFAGHAFDLDAYQQETLLLPRFAFSSSATITIHYTDTKVTGLNESTLALAYWNEVTSMWENAACGPYDRHPDENWLAVSVCHLSRFALFGKEYQIFLPLVLNNH